MTYEELRASEGYKEAMAKIRGYSKGFEFTIYYGSIPRAKANGLRFVLNDAKDFGLIESIAIGYNIDMEEVEERFRRL